MTCQRTISGWRATKASVCTPGLSNSGVPGTSEIGRLLPLLQPHGNCSLTCASLNDLRLYLIVRLPVFVIPTNTVTASGLKYWYWRTPMPRLQWEGGAAKTLIRTTAANKLAAMKMITAALRLRITTMVSGAGPPASELRTEARIPGPLHQRVRPHLRPRNPASSALPSCSVKPQNPSLSKCFRSSRVNTRSKLPIR